MRALHTGGSLAEPRRCHGGIGCSVAVRRRHFAGQRRHHGALQVTPEEGVEIRRGVWWRTHRTPEAGRTQNGTMMMIPASRRLLQRPLYLLWTRQGCLAMSTW